ncbi:protein involved in polysaccharide export, contains SLBB domain of the beta-grasp fold [Orenia metallireducens]|uniref:Protein involved in polysaccharide export, contains SLBB domain of the beta-grasp fold n=1 Tax=Orenia metallireducens TaxID=1413210 RepID=A0A285GLJ8_9FIRM|nr:SLBB domain-containing protein [Orenia metallireducens]SNY24500.1 protein involved in polysaccharide export, contains SLBB domain of the beta-grasp fold [Orenia metallireducens]
MRRLLCFLIAFVFVITIMPQEIIASEYKLTVDDQLYISVWGHEDLKQEVSVGPEMVLGQVDKPGTYQLEPQSRVLELISLAGGLNETADLNNAKLTRGEETLAINLKNLLSGKSTEMNYLLEEGDVLYIGDESIEVNIVGEISSPGRYKLKQGATINDLIAQAGGVTTDASNQVKYVSEGVKEELNLDKIVAFDTNSNKLLTDGDSVYIEKGKYSLRKSSFWTNLFFFVGGLNGIKDLTE